jgi:hypothetical protein
MSSSVSFNRRCRAITAKGEPCKAWAMQDSDLCAAHSGRTGTNRQTHGFYAKADKPESRPRGKGLETIDDVIADALHKQARLSAILDNTADVDGEDLAKLLAIHGQNASRLGRLLRDKRALSGESTDSLLHALGTALDEIATELGITL